MTGSRDFSIGAAIPKRLEDLLFLWGEITSLYHYIYYILYIINLYTLYIQGLYICDMAVACSYRFGRYVARKVSSLIQIDHAASDKLCLESIRILFVANAVFFIR